jgi:glycosyltransferase involved in cell wall biosynthesis
MWRGIVDRHACGVVVDPANPVAIAAAIEALLDDPVRAQAMGEAGLAAVRSTYRWPVAERELLALYDRLVGPPGGGAAR